MSYTIDICDELKQNFIDFAYEANSQRAFPDARDGLKPGQRACLWEMFIKGYSSGKPHVKSAKVSGGVAATWWPHGTTAIYETFARMSQPWINNIPEVDWHGSNGNIVIGSIPAADRYTEARLNKAIEEGMFQGIKKNTVPMILNFSEDEEWPEVLPAIFPRLLVNGSQGIGVTVAQTWLPHNLSDVVKIVNDYLNTGVLDYSGLAPDFPTGGTIINKSELSNIYATGKGKAIVRGKCEVKGNTIQITELPYQVYVEPFIEEIRELVEKEEITGIDDVFNKTDKKRTLIEIECTTSPLSVLNKLYALTSLQKTFSANQFALVSKTPKLLTLKDYIDIYIAHNIECIVKEATFDRDKAKSKVEILEGLIKALEDIDNIINLIKKSESAAAAKTSLISTYGFTEPQAQAIVDMKLGKLARLEAVELNKECAELTKKVNELESLLADESAQKKEFLKRLLDFNKKYGNARRSEITNVEITKAEKEVVMVEPEKCVVIMTEGGSIKRVPSAAFRVQKRSGKGIKTQDDITASIIRTNTVDSLMIFSDKGKMYRLLVNDIPEGTNTSKGTSIKGLVPMEVDEKPTVIYSIYKDTTAKYVIFITKNGLVKKTSLEEYIDTKKKTGIAAITLRDGDELVYVSLVNDEDLVIMTKKGQGIRFNSMEIGATSRTTSGVKGITLAPDDFVATATPIRDKKDQLAVFTNSGYGKKIVLSDIPLQKRAGKGIKFYKDELIADIAMVSDEDSVLLVANNTSLCLSAKDIPSIGRAGLGNTMIKTTQLISVSKV